MDSVELQWPYVDLRDMSNTEITLPIEIASDSLTLEEIGALVVLSAMPHLKRESNWFIDERLHDLLDEFMSEEIVTQPKNPDNALQLEIDLTWV